MTTTEASPLTNSDPSPRVRRSRAIGRLGTTTRALVGVALLALGITSGGAWIAWWQLGLGLVGLPAAVTMAQLARLSFTKRQLNQTDHLALCLNCAILVALLSVSATRDATLVFLGASMLLAAARGYGGGESLAISNSLLRRGDQVGCLLFSPLDQLETRRISRSAFSRRRATPTRAPGKGTLRSARSRSVVGAAKMRVPQ